MTPPVAPATARPAMEPLRSSRLDAGLLAQWFRLLSTPGRIELLAQLQEPRTLDELRIQPAPAQAGERPERPISRPAIRKHVELLQNAGIVKARATQRDGRRTATEYFLDHSRLFALIEEIRKIGAFEGRVLDDLAATILAGQAPATHWDPGPKLVVVHGIREGRAFPLRPGATSGGRGWVIGRKTTCPIHLEYDPFVSTENAEIARRGDGYAVVDLRNSRNGTSVNWRRLPPGGEALLSSGDVIGVGRSLLVFRPL